MVSQTDLDTQQPLPPASVIVTVLNEAQTIGKLLAALEKQVVLPQEVVIADGGSSDETVALIKKWTETSPLIIRYLETPGNRSVGRNAAIESVKTEWMAITDAGCEPHPTWLAELLKTQREANAQVVAGYYTAHPKTPLETAIVPYALVMPDRVDPANFLPATRSMLVSKTIWQKAGKFDENLADNEDYALAKKLQQMTPIAFARQAVVTWQPPETLSAFTRMIYRFARGDVQANILRPKVILIFARYLVFFALLLLFSVAFSPFLFVILLILASVYSLWSIGKNYQYAKKAWYWLPVLQVVSDVAVITGSLVGMGNQGN